VFPDLAQGEFHSDERLCNSRPDIGSQVCVKGDARCASSGQRARIITTQEHSLRTYAVTSNRGTRLLFTICRGEALLEYVCGALAQLNRGPNDASALFQGSIQSPCILDIDFFTQILQRSSTLPILSHREFPRKFGQQKAARRSRSMRHFRMLTKTFRTRSRKCLRAWLPVESHRNEPLRWDCLAIRRSTKAP